MQIREGLPKNEMNEENWDWDCGRVCTWVTESRKGENTAPFSKHELNLARDPLISLKYRNLERFGKPGLLGY